MNTIFDEMDQLRTIAEILELKRQVINLNVQMATIKGYLASYMSQNIPDTTIEDVLNNINEVQETIASKGEIKESIDKYQAEVKEFEELVKMSNSFTKFFNGEKVTDEEKKAGLEFLCGLKPDTSNEQK